MAHGRLLGGYQSIMKQIYYPKNSYRRVRPLLKEVKALEIYRPINMQQFLSFFRSAFRLGVLGKERFQYWRLMLWIIIRMLKHIPLAVTLSFYGHHVGM